MFDKVVQILFLYKYFSLTALLQTYLAKIRDITYNRAAKINDCTNGIINYGRR